MNDLLETWLPNVVDDLGPEVCGTADYEICTW